MSVAGILGSSLFNFITQSVQSKGQQFKQEFQQLGLDLQSGNLSAAQVDLASLQPSGPQTNSTSTSTSSVQNNDPIGLDFKQLSQDLQSGNVSAAQQDYAKIQQDFQNQAASRHAHHHHQGGGGGEASAISQLMQQLGQDLQTGNLTDAQKAYGTLQQQFALSNGLFQPSSTSTSNSVSVNA
jgi:hypothetical protein